MKDNDKILGVIPSNKIWVVVLIGVFIVATVLIIDSITNKKYELTPSQAVAWTTLRVSIAESRLYGGSTSLSSVNVAALKDSARSFNKNCEWFSDTSIKYYGYGKTQDTDKYQISSLCDGSYCATFKMEHKDGNYYLVDYKFEASSEKDYTIYIK